MFNPVSMGTRRSEDLTVPDWSNAAGTIQPSLALGQHVVDRLRRMVITAAIPADTHLVEQQLSDVFQVSRGPIRDALRQLENEGLVETRRRGVFVVGLKPEDIEELYKLRQVLEGEAVRECMVRGIPNEPSLEQPVAVMFTAAQAGDSVRFAEADLEFHSAFYALAGNRRLRNVWQQYRPTFADMLLLTNADDDDLMAAHRDHLALLQLLEAGDAATAGMLLTKHIDGARCRMLRSYEHHSKRNTAGISKT